MQKQKFSSLPVENPRITFAFFSTQTKNAPMYQRFLPFARFPLSMENPPVESVDIVENYFFRYFSVFFGIFQNFLLFSSKTPIKQRFSPRICFFWCFFPVVEGLVYKNIMVSPCTFSAIFDTDLGFPLFFHKLSTVIRKLSTGLSPFVIGVCTTFPHYPHPLLLLRYIYYYYSY